MEWWHFPLAKIMNTDEKQSASWCSASSVTPDVTEISDINGTFSVKISAVAWNESDTFTELVQMWKYPAECELEWQVLPVLTSQLLAPIARQNTSNLCGLAARLVECGHTTWGRDKQSFCLYSLFHQVQTNCTSPIFSSGRISRSFFFFFPLTFY